MLLEFNNAESNTMLKNLDDKILNLLPDLNIEFKNNSNIKPNIKLIKNWDSNLKNDKIFIISLISKYIKFKSLVKKSS